VDRRAGRLEAGQPDLGVAAVDRVGLRLAVAPTAVPCVYDAMPVWL
jgi:hypothetical protein